jgi:hypothetical protein
VNRLEFAQSLLRQPATACPFLNAVDTSTRDEILEQHPEPHSLPEDKLLEIAKQLGFNPNDLRQILLPHHINENLPRTPVGAGTRPALPHNENTIHPEIDFFGFELLDSFRAGRPQGSPLEAKGIDSQNTAYLETDFFGFDFSDSRPTGQTHNSSPQDYAELEENP